MNKKEILSKLKTLNFPKNDYIIISGASLVLQDIIEETHDIDLTCSRAFYETITWPEKIGAFDKKIKYDDVFEIGYNLYDKKSIITLDGYRLMNLEKCLEIKKILNRKKDKKVIEKLDLYLCQKDNYRYEKNLRQNGINYIAGVDEVGRGPLVGPVVAACVVLPDKFSLDGLTDSKKLSIKKRDYFFEEIKKQALGIGVGIIDNKKIDEVNIYEATKLAMKEAIDDCLKNCKIQHILIDAMPLDISINTTSIIKGDIKSVSISAASVIAKVTRDRMLDELDDYYPMYDFKNNKGYPTKKHLEAIKKYGIIDEHRRSYGPVRDYLENCK